MRPERLRLISNLLGWSSFVAMIAALYAVFVYVPTERVMGIIQRIFYFHVPSAWVAFVAFALVFIGSICFLWKKERTWDMLAHASAEIGVVFTTLVLITGPLWAKPVWNTWWTWDPRLSTTLVLWLIYVAYLMLRSFAADEEKAARFAAVFGIIGFVDVPIVFMSIRWWRSIHPVVIQPKSMGMAPPMALTLLISVLAFTLFYVWLLVHRVQLEQAKEEVHMLKRRLTSAC